MNNKPTTTKNQPPSSSSSSTLKQPNKIAIPTPFLTANNAPKNSSSKDVKDSKDEKDKTLNRTRTTTAPVKTSTPTPDNPSSTSTNATTSTTKQVAPQLTPAEEKKENRRSIRLFGTLPRSNKVSNKITPPPPNDANPAPTQSNGTSTSVSKSTSSKSTKVPENNNNATSKTIDSTKPQTATEPKESTHSSVFNDIKRALTKTSSDVPQQEKQDKVLMDPDPPKTKASRSSTVEDLNNQSADEQSTPKNRRKSKKEKKEREAMQNQINEFKELVDKLSTKVTELSTSMETEVSRRKLLEESYVKLKVSFEQFKLEQFNKYSGNLGAVKLNALSNQTEEQQYNQWTRKLSVDHGISSSSESSKESKGTIGKKGIRGSIALALKRSVTSPEKDKDKEVDKETDSTVRIQDTDEDSSRNSSRNATLDSKNMSLEAIAKADLIKEQLGNKYSSFATLRRRQIEQLETRKRVPGPMDTRRRSMSLDNGSARLPSDSSADELMKSELRKSKEYIEVSKLLNNRQAKNVLVQKGILSNNLFGVPIESIPMERDIPIFVMNALSFIESKLDEYTIEEIFESSFPQETIDAARRIVESGNIEFANMSGSKLNLNQNQSSITDPRVVAELLKLFFKRLPDALIPFKGHKYFIQWNEIDDNEEYKIDTMRSLIYFIPLSNRSLLHYFTNFIYRVCIYNDITDAETIDHGRDSVNVTQSPPHFMTTLNTLARVFGPFILRAPTMSLKSEDYLKQLEKQLTATANSKLQPEPKLQFEEEKAGENLVRFLVLNHGVFQDEAEVQYTMQQGKRLVTACSVPKIFVKLMDEYYNESDPHWTEVVLLTHMYHVKADNLLDFLCQHCKSIDRPWRNRLRSRAMRILKQWLGNFGSLLKTDKAFVEKFKSFIESNQSLKEETVFTKFLQYVNDPEADNAGTDYQSPVGKEFPYDSVDLMEIANHIHLLDYEYLGLIRPQEFLDKSFSYPDRSPNFHKMADQWNRRTLWVVTEILKRDKPSKRANCIDFFIKISHILRNLNDFHSSYAIIVALNHNTISRLKKSWVKLSKKAMGIYQNLLELFDMSYNFKTYRAALSTAHGSYAVIPYIGLLPKDLTSLEEIPNKTDSELINFAKMRKLWSAIGQIRQYQMNNKYIIAVDQINHELYEALKNPKVFTDKEMREISELHEPSQRRSPLDSPKVPITNVSSTGSSQLSPNTSNSSLLSRSSSGSKSARPANVNVPQPAKDVLLSSMDKSDAEHSIHTHELNDMHIAMSNFRDRDRDSYNSFTEDRETENYATTIEVSEPDTSENEEPQSRIKRVNFELNSLKDDESSVADDNTADDFSSSDDDDGMAELSALSSRLPPAAANSLTEISRVSFSPDSFSQYPFPTSSRIPGQSNPYGKPPLINETFSPPKKIRPPRSPSMSAKEKADVIKDMFTSKYGNLATYRKGQLQQLSQGRKGRTQVLKRGRLDDAFWEIKAHSMSDQSSDDDDDDFDNNF